MSKSLPDRVFRVQIAILMAVVWTGYLQHSQRAYAQTAGGASSGQVQQGPTPEDLKKLADKLEKIFDALEEAAKEIPRETFDPEVIIHGQPGAGFEGVGTDPIKLFEWVRDNTYLVPYRGVLRDYKGVLMDRLGNSLDRTLLLFTLLRLAGHDTLRLAQAELSDEESAELLDKVRPIPEEGALPRAQQPSPVQLAEKLEKYAEKYDLDPAELRKVIDQTSLKAQRLAEEAVQRTVEQSKAILELLKEGGVEIPSREEQMTQLRADAIKALRHHWWLQWHNGRQWVDLDPSLPDAKVGQPFVKMQKIVPGNELTERLRNEMHTVQIRIIIERWEDGKLVEVPVLTQELFPAAFMGEHIGIHHAPMNWPEDFNPFEEEEPLEALKKAVLAQREWVPVLTVGDKRVSKYSFTDAGEINDPTLPGFVQNVLAGRTLVKGMEDGVRVLGNRVFNLLARVEQYEPGPQKPTESNEQLKTTKPTGPAQLTAEWIEYEICVPGEEPQKVRRQIFDLIGPAARAAPKKRNTPAPEITAARRLERGLTLLGETEILFETGAISSEFVEHSTAHRLCADRKVLTELVGAGGYANPVAASRLAPKLTPLSGRLYAWALARAQWSRHRNDLCLDRPTILSHHTYYRPSRKYGIVTCYGLDIVANGVNVPLQSRENPFLVRLHQGVLDTNVEARLMRGCGAKDNTAELHAMSNAQNVKWTVAKDTSDERWQHVDLPADARARIQGDVAAGYVCLVPEKPIIADESAQVGWWRINPRTGQALGIGNYGWGQVTIESLEMLMISIKQVEITMTYVLCLNLAVAGGVEGAEGLQMANIQCLAETYRDQGGAYAMGLVRNRVLGSLGSQIYDLLSGVIGLSQQAGSR